MKESFSKILTAIATPFLWIAGLVLYIVVVFAKGVLFVYELIIPRGLRELVPILNLWRRYLIYASNLFASQEKMEMVKIEEEIEEVQMKEDRINKAYPIQRGVGETYDHLLIIFVIIGASILLVQSQTADFDVLMQFVQERYLAGVDPKYHWLIITAIGVVCSTVMGMLSFVATIFGPIYALALLTASPSRMRQNRENRLERISLETEVFAGLCSAQQPCWNALSRTIYHYITTTDRGQFASMIYSQPVMRR